MNDAFLDLVDVPKGRWRDPEAEKKGIHSAYRWTGLGRDGLEVVFGTAGARPSTTAVRELWKQRHGVRANGVTTDLPERYRSAPPSRLGRG